MFFSRSVLFLNKTLLTRPPPDFTSSELLTDVKLRQRKRQKTFLHHFGEFVVNQSNETSDSSTITGSFSSEQTRLDHQHQHAHLKTVFQAVRELRKRRPEDEETLGFYTNRIPQRSVTIATKQTVNARLVRTALSSHPSTRQKTDGWKSGVGDGGGVSHNCHV